METSAGRFRTRNGDTMIKGLLGLLIIFLLSTFPATWLLMLFMGNAAPAMGLSYWGTLPLGILVSVLIGGATAPAVVIRD
jgi:hypothetical protein